MTSFRISPSATRRRAGLHESIPLRQLPGIAREPERRSNSICMSRISASTSAFGTAIGIGRKQLLHDLPLEARLHGLGQFAFHVLANFGAERFDAPFADAEGLAEGRVDLRQVALLHFAHDGLESRGLAGQLLDLVLVGKAQVELDRSRPPECRGRPARSPAAAVPTRER